jgi:tetratricopeptide (TPR) repeat protein
LTRLRSLPFALALAGLIPGNTAAPAQPPDRLAAWTAAVNAHQAGDPGKPAVDIASWPPSEVDAIVASVKRQVRALDSDRRDEGNALLLRGAVFHADIAKLIPDDPVRRSPSQVSIFAVEDGRQYGIRYPTLHWAVARSLLEGVLPTPAGHPSVLSWYRLASVYMLKTGVLVEEREHLERARQLFPNDPDILFDSGNLHERFSSPVLQAAAESIALSKGGRPDISSARVELERAERFYRQMLGVQSGRPGARLRLGRIVGELGRHQDAVVELRKAIDAGAAGPELYFAELFLGREEEALGNGEAARDRYERAATLYPRAQSPKLALSMLARRAGDRVRARRELQQMGDLPADASRREDPWWTYYAR